VFSKLNRAEKYLNSAWGELIHTVMPLKPTLCNQSWTIPEKRKKNQIIDSIDVEGMPLLTPDSFSTWSFKCCIMQE